jgi:hypothetical protein
MCGKQAGLKSPNLKKMLGEAFHLCLKRHTASRRSNGIVNKLFDQITTEEWVTQAACGNLKCISRGLSLEVSERGRMS